MPGAFDPFRVEKSEAGPFLEGFAIAAEVSGGGLNRKEALVGDLDQSNGFPDHRWTTSGNPAGILKLPTDSPSTSKTEARQTLPSNTLVKPYRTTSGPQWARLVLIAGRCPVCLTLNFRRCACRIAIALSRTSSHLPARCFRSSIHGLSRLGPRTSLKTSICAATARHAAAPVKRRPGVD